MSTVESQSGMDVWNRGDESREGLGAVVFLMVSFCVTLIVLVGAIVMCQGPTVVVPF